jgi:hypothetical protein
MTVTPICLGHVREMPISETIGFNVAGLAGAMAS